MIAFKIAILSMLVVFITVTIVRVWDSINPLSLKLNQGAQALLGLIIGLGVIVSLVSAIIGVILI